MLQPNNNALVRVEITKHAVDRYSERRLETWINNNEGLGLMSFLVKKSREAYTQILSSIKDKSITINSCKINYEDITFVFSNDDGVTKLITVY